MSDEEICAKQEAGKGRELKRDDILHAKQEEILVQDSMELVGVGAVVAMKQEREAAAVTAKLDAEAEARAAKTLHDEAVKSLCGHFSDPERWYMNPPGMDYVNEPEWESALLQLVTDKLGVLSADEIFAIVQQDDSITMSIVYPILKDKLSKAALVHVLENLIGSDCPNISQLKEVARGLSTEVLSRSLELILEQLGKVPDHEDGHRVYHIAAKGPYIRSWFSCYDPHPLYGDPAKTDGSCNERRSECVLDLFHYFVKEGALVSQKSRDVIEKGLALWNPMLYSATRPRNCYGPWHTKGIQKIVEALWLMKYFPDKPPTPLPPAPPTVEHTTKSKAVRKRPTRPAQSQSKGAFSEAPDGEICVLDYSDKAIAVFGHTNEVKDGLMLLGGKFNKNLKRNNRKEPGWIFQKKRKSEVEAFLKR